MAVYNSYPFWTVAGVILLALRYWQGKAAERRQIRWLLIGVTGSFSLWVPLFLLWWRPTQTARPPTPWPPCCPPWP